MKSTKKTTRFVAAALMAFTLLAGGIGFSPTRAQASFLPGGAVGPVAPDGGLYAGFPLWFQDQNGIRLDLMEAADAFSISDPVVPGTFSEQLGFNAEGFWWSAEAGFDNGTQTGLLVLAMEGVFAGETAVDGEQSAFGRLRIRIDGLTPNTQYTVRHPYGTSVFTSDGTGVINEPGGDIGCIATGGVTTCDPAKVGTGNPALVSAGSFSVALSSQVGPFLTWDTFGQTTFPVTISNPLGIDPNLINPANPGRTYVGNPSIEHAITGSPVGQNFFRVEGPGLPGGVITQPLFTVSGRFFAPVVTVDSSIISDNTPALTGTINDTTATIDVTVDGNTFAATNNGDGTWTLANDTITPALADGTYNVAVSATPTSGGVGTDSTTNELVVDTVSPVVSEVTAVANPTTDNTPNYVFNSSEAGTITYGGSCSSATTTTAAGNKTVTFNALVLGLHDDCTVKVTDAAGNISNTQNVTAFTVKLAPVSIFRFWSDAKQGHFYTASEAEKDGIIANDKSWKFEGPVFKAFNASDTNLTPIYRFWSQSKQHHFYTASAAERDLIIANDKSWSFEGTAYQAYLTEQPNTTALYRFWSDAKQGHFYTTSVPEKDGIIANDKSWKFEGIAYFVPIN